MEKLTELSNSKLAIESRKKEKKKNREEKFAKMTPQDIPYDQKKKKVCKIRHFLESIVKFKKSIPLLYKSIPYKVKY